LEQALNTAYRLTDYVFQREYKTIGGRVYRPGRDVGAKPPGLEDGFVIPVTIDDLAANGLLDEVQPQVCWERSIETLTARKDDIAGLAVASDEQIEAYVLYVERGEDQTEIVSLRSFIEDGGARLRQLLAHLRARGTTTFWFPKVHPEEIAPELLEAIGFRPAGGYLLYAAKAQAE